jgi:hypothetical protein
MITMILGYLGTAAGGALMKGVFGLVQEIIHAMTRPTVVVDNPNESLHIDKFANADNYTKHTRRMLALIVCVTYCSILGLWACFPQTEIATFIELGNSEPKGHGLTLFGYGLIGVESPVDLARRTIVVTTGHLVLANSYVLTFILSAYFMPVGRR